MRVVVIGATGFTGSAITQELLARNHEVVGVARSTDSLPGHRGLTAEAGSVHDLNFVQRVATGADAVVIAIQSRATETSPALSEAIVGIAQTVAKTGARLGVVGGAGSLFVAEGGPRLFDTPEFPAAFVEGSRGAYAVLQALLASDNSTGDWFYLSPAAGYGKHNSGERLGHYRTGGDILVKDAEGKSDISQADYAIAFVDELETPVHHRVRFTAAY